MDITKKVAELRLGYHLNMIDVYNVMYQLHLISGVKADQRNKAHLKECLDCYERLGYNFPKEIKDFKEES